MPRTSHLRRLLIQVTLSLPLVCILILLAVPHAQGQSVKVGMLLPLSGPYAVGGDDSVTGIKAAQSESALAGELEIVYADSQALPAAAISEFRRLTERDAVAAVYTLRGPVGMAIKPIAKSSRTPLVGGVGNPRFTSDNEFAFQAWSSSTEEGEFLAQQLHAARHRTVALITTEDDWLSSVSDAITSHAKPSTLAVVSDERVEPSTTELRSILTKVISRKPDAIVVNMGIGQIGLAITQLAALGNKAPIYSNFWASKPEVAQAAGTALDGVRFVEMNTHLPALPTGSSGATLAAYVATHLLAQAVAEAKPLPTRATVHTALLKQRNVATAAGIFEVHERRIRFPLILKEMRNGQAIVATVR